MGTRQLSDVRKSAPLRALTIRQPNASLIIAGLMSHELRPTAAPSWAIRRRIVVHAASLALTFDDLFAAGDEIQHGQNTGISRRDRPSALDLLKRHWHDRSTFPAGAALGTAHLGDPRCAREALEDRLEIADIDPDWFVWPLRDPEPFPAPIPIAGQPGFWRFPSNAELADRERQRPLALAANWQRNGHARRA